VVGLIYEASGGYEVPFVAIALASLVGLAVLAAFGPHGPADGVRPLAQAVGRYAQSWRRGV
jgi:HAMP domain-containing protein